MNGQVALIRQLQIDMITDHPNPIITYFNSTIGNKLKSTQINVHHTNGSEIVYHTGNKIMMYYDHTNKIYNINFHIWNNLRYKYDINYPNYVIIIQLLLEHHLNLSIPLPTRMHFLLRYKIDELLFNTNDYE